MIEVFPENDYNCLMDAAALLGVTVVPRSRGMVMRDGGEIVGVILWTERAGADIYAVKAPDEYGAYFDLIVRSALNHLIKSGVDTVTVDGVNSFYTQFGFAEGGQKMSAKSADIKFPHHCKTGGIQ